jgi:hypothetical protein
MPELALRNLGVTLVMQMWQYHGIKEVLLPFSQ